MKATFVIPCLNAAETLSRCIESIRTLETTAEREVIVVDNGSTDSSPSIAEDLADRTLSLPDATISKLRNQGASEGSGEILCFIDSDCVLNSDWLQRTLAHLEKDDIGMVGARTHILPETAGWIERAWKVHLDRDPEICDTAWIVTRALAVKRELFEKVNGFDTSLVTCEDVALGYAINKHSRVVADSRLAPLHLEDPTTLSELFKKEVWRAKDSVSISLKNITTPKEQLSLLIPIYFLCSALALPLALAYSWSTSNSLPTLLVLFALFTPIFLVTIDTCIKAKNWSNIPGLISVYSTYLAARVVAFLKTFSEKKKDSLPI